VHAAMQRAVTKYTSGHTFLLCCAAQLAGQEHLVAVKVLNSQQFRNIRDIDAVRNELGVMQSLRHPHIIDMLDVVFRDGKFYIILECATGGDVKDYIREQVRAAFTPELHPEEGCQCSLPTTKATEYGSEIACAAQERRRVPGHGCQQPFQHAASALAYVERQCLNLSLCRRAEGCPSTSARGSSSR
jgi:serine/threonine protein kinase